MLTLKRHFLETEAEDKNLFVALHSDTHKAGYLSGWDRFFKGDLTNSKPWIGEVNTNEKQFKITRTRTGIFRSGISSIVIKGQEVNDGIELTYGLSWIAVINSMIVTLFLSFAVTLFLSDSWGLLLLLPLWIIVILLIIHDLNKTEECFNRYLDSGRKSVLPQSSVTNNKIV